MYRTFLLLTLAACTQKVGFQQPNGDDTAEGDTGYVHDTDTDTADTDGDLDNDGFTPEEGDCDDTNIRVSPALDEQEGDGLDNDCDGRIDEAWAGVYVAYGNEDGAAEILTVDAIGRVDDDATVTLSDDCAPVWMDALPSGWVINNGQIYVAAVDAEGTCTTVADFSDAEAFPFGVWGVAAAPDGTIYATTLGSLYQISPDGTLTEVASWPFDLEDPAKHELAAYSVAVDPESGEVALFGYFGGFATWTADGGVVMHASEDLENILLYTSSGAHRDEGGWYTPGIDAKTGAAGIYEYDLGADAWVQQETWEDEDWQPFSMAIDGDTGDYYVTANAGWYYTVWRIVTGSGYAGVAYTTDGDIPHRGFYGIASRYTYGE